MSRFEPVTFGFFNLPEWKATPTGCLMLLRFWHILGYICIYIINLIAIIYFTRIGINVYYTWPIVKVRMRQINVDKTGSSGDRFT